MCCSVTLEKQAKCGSLAGECRRRAHKVPANDPDRRAEREFLLRFAPELERMGKRGK